MVNVAPAKPSRRIPEHEYKALLSDTSCSTLDNTLQVTPQSATKMYLETSFSNRTDEVNQSNAMSDENSPNWDYEETQCTQMDSEQQQPTCEQVRQVKSKRNFKLDFSGSENWNVVPAPLATPETLSESSSVESTSYQRRSGGYQKLIMGMPTMEPIQQSPLRQLKSGGYNYFIHAPSPVDYADSPEREFTPINHTTASASSRHSTPAKRSTVTAEVTVEAAACDTLSNHSNELSPDSNCVTEHLLKKEQKDCHRVTQKQPSKSCDGKSSAPNSKRPSPERIANAPEQFQLVFENERPLASYIRHSPDTPDSYVNQIGYDLTTSHYSQAGRGYPHGAYMAVEIPDPGLPMTPEPSPIETTGETNSARKIEGYNLENGCVNKAVLSSSELQRRDQGYHSGSSPKTIHNGPPSFYRHFSDSDEVFTTEDVPILEESQV